ncbi:MAG: DsbA family protein [Rhodobacteraceae bacterium]|nr:DsbA family protein [Paracoccaceae bacterium]
MMHFSRWAGVAVVLAALFGPFGPQTAAAEDAQVDTSSVEDMAIGNPDAPVTVIEYASFTCPHCAKFEADVFPELKKNYVDTGKVRFILREVYFDRYGLWASMVARCGGEMRFFGIGEMLFRDQREWLKGEDPTQIADNLRRIGRSAGLTDDQVNACLSDAKTAETLVAWYNENRAKDGIDATPTFLIDGDKHSNMSYDEFSQALDAKLGQDG